jgi:hypothetical protein
VVGLREIARRHRLDNVGCAAVHTDGCALFPHIETTDEPEYRCKGERPYFAESLLVESVNAKDVDVRPLQCQGHVRG